VPTHTPTGTATATPGGPTATATITFTPRPPICEAIPASGCRRPLKADKRTLFVKLDTAKPKKNRFTYEWRRGDAIPGDFGSPEMDDGTALNFCVYHGPPRQQVMGFDILPGGTCDGKPCWKKRTNGIGLSSFKYRNRNKDGAYGPGKGNEAGVYKTRLKEGVTLVPPDARMIVKARDLKIPTQNLPAGSGGEMFNLPVLVQVQAHDAETGMLLPVCWESEFSAASKNTGKKFKAANDPPAP
jgi:hypothetical protein